MVLSEREIELRSEIWEETREKTPCMHGLLESMAYKVYKSPNREKYGAPTETSDWYKAVGLLVEYMTEELKSGPIGSFEDYLRDKISHLAEVTSEGDDKGEFSNWMFGVESVADDVFGRIARYYLSRAA